MPQTRGDCSTALKFESSETVHEGPFCHVPRGKQEYYAWSKETSRTNSSANYFRNFHAERHRFP